jgi:hypothetical protein
MILPDFHHSGVLLLVVRVPLSGLLLPSLQQTLRLQLWEDSVSGPLLHPSL